MNYQITHDGFLCRGMYVIGLIKDMKNLYNGCILITIENNRFRCPEVSVCMNDIKVA